MLAIWPINKFIAFAFVPYLIWVTLATALQFSIFLKN
jgi:benzodiazapine receptor/tryptophan-rich sensory protein